MATSTLTQLLNYDLPNTLLLLAGLDDCVNDFNSYSHLDALPENFQLAVTQTCKRFKRMLFIRIKHNLQILGVIPFIKLQNNT